jgi:cyclic lactone autoinducer peptide
MKSKGTFLSMLAALSIVLAGAASTNTSYIWIYQPKFPEKLRKL